MNINVNLIVLLGFLFFFPFRGMADKQEELPDSLFTPAYITKYHITEPERMLSLLDMAEVQNRIPQYRIEDLRSMIYNNKRWFKMATIALRKALASDSVRADPLYELRLQCRECQLLMSDSKYAEVIRIATGLIEKVHRLGSRQMKADFQLYLGRSYLSLGQEERGVACLEQAIRLLEATTDVREMAMLSTYYGAYMNHLIVYDRYDEAIALGIRRGQLIEKMSLLPGPPAYYIDQQRGYFNSKMAYLYQLTGKPELATACYKAYLATRFASDPFYSGEGINYLFAAKRYKEAMVLCEKKMGYAWADTISFDYRAHLNLCSEVAAGIGDYRRSLDFCKRMAAVSDSLDRRNNENRLFEMSTLYETHEKDFLIQKAEADMQMRNLQLLSVGGIAFLLGILLWLNYRHTRIVKLKNRSLAEKIDLQMDISDNLQTLREHNRFLTTRLQILQAESGIQEDEPVSADQNRDALSGEQTENKELFEELNDRLLSDKLFLDPNLSREDLIRIVNVNKNRFAQIIQENTGGNLKEYLNSLRTDHSIRLLREHPDYTLEAIAADSGFTNRGTFHSSFRKRTGMTPTEYKNVFC